jgi:N utilization substance protein B
MGRRRKARECALQVLYELEFQKEGVDEVLKDYWSRRREPKEIKEYCDWLVRGVWNERPKLDTSIQEVSEHWRLARMAVVDRNILRLAAYELEAEPHLEPAIIINEAIEIAKKFSGEEAAHFVNGLLDALRKKRGEKSFEEEAKKALKGRKKGTQLKKQTQEK